MKKSLPQGMIRLHKKILIFRLTILPKYARMKARRMERCMALIDSFVSQSRQILSSRLEGIYLHGSSVMGCFNPQKSDIDLLVVVKEAIPDAAKIAFMDMVVELNGEAPAKGIEMDMVRKDVCNSFIYPTPF